MNCRKARRLLVELAALSLTADDRRRLEQHADECPRCREEYDAITATARVAAKRTVVEPTQEQWAEFDRRLRRGLQGAQRLCLAERVRLALQTNWLWTPSRSLAVGAVAAVFIAGLVLLAVLREEPASVGEPEIEEATILEIQDLEFLGPAPANELSIETVRLENAVFVGVAEVDEEIRPIELELDYDTLLNELWIQG